MSKFFEFLKEITEKDQSGIFNKTKKEEIFVEYDHLKRGFDEINDFFKKVGREPENNINNIKEYTLYKRLNHIRNNSQQCQDLQNDDKYKLLSQQTVNSDIDIIEKSNESNIFDIKNIPKNQLRKKSDYIGRRTICNNFEKYKDKFQKIQNDIKLGKRSTASFKQVKNKPNHIKKGNFYILKGLLLYVDKVDRTSEEQTLPSGKRVRLDGRTRLIFENGTESDILLRSLVKALELDGRIVERENSISFKNINVTKKAIIKTGNIYVAKLAGENKKIGKMVNLYKIGLTKNNSLDRIKNSSNDPTYLFSKVVLVKEWEVFNHDLEKLEFLIHKFFSNSKLDINIEQNGLNYKPNEWFIVPLNIISDAIELIINGSITNYYYNSSTCKIELL